MLYISWHERNPESKLKNYAIKPLKNMTKQQRLNRTSLKHIIFGELL